MAKHGRVASNFTRKVYPFGNVTVNVDLERVISGARGPEYPRDVQTLTRWVREGHVELAAVAPHHVIPHSVFAEYKDYPATGKSEAHQHLCKIGALYVGAVCGEVTSFQDNALCDYPGGRADAACCAHRFVVECGLLRSDKPFHAMVYGWRMLLLPYEVPDMTTKARDRLRCTDDPAGRVVGYVLRANSDFANVRAELLDAQKRNVRAVLNERVTAQEGSSGGKRKRSQRKPLF